MTSGADTDFKDVLADNKDVSEQQILEDVESKLKTCSDRLTLCFKILDDLRDLNEILVRKSLQDVTLPLQK